MFHSSVLNEKRFYKSVRIKAKNNKREVRYRYCKVNLIKHDFIASISVGRSTFLPVLY